MQSAQFTTQGKLPFVIFTQARRHTKHAAHTRALCVHGAATSKHHASREVALRHFIENGLRPPLLPQFEGHRKHLHLRGFHRRDGTALPTVWWTVEPGRFLSGPEFGTQALVELINLLAKNFEVHAVFLAYSLDEEKGLRESRSWPSSFASRMLDWKKLSKQRCRIVFLNGVWRFLRRASSPLRVKAPGLYRCWLACGANVWAKARCPAARPLILARPVCGACMCKLLSHSGKIRCNSLMWSFLPKLPPERG